MLKLFSQTYTEWNKDRAPQLAAALSYYSTFSLAPCLIIIVSILGVYLEAEEAQRQVFDFVETNLGTESAHTMLSMMQAAEGSDGGALMTVITFLMLLFAASGVFTQLQFSLNTIWNVRLRPDIGIKETLKKRLISFLLIIVIGALLMASLIAMVVITIAFDLVVELLPAMSYMYPLIEIILSVGFVSLVCMLIYKYFPDVHLKWSNVWAGGLLAGVMFLIGKILLSWYFGYANVGSAYGAAGSFIVILLWIYYSNMLLLFGAEFTQVYSKAKKMKVKPEAIAISEKHPIILSYNQPGFISKFFMAIKVVWAEIKLALFALRTKKKVSKFFSRKKK